MQRRQNGLRVKKGVRRERGASLPFSSFDIPDMSGAVFF
jgi:hypothetical protein